MRKGNYISPKEARSRIADKAEKYLKARWAAWEGKNPSRQQLAGQLAKLSEALKERAGELVEEA